MIEAAIWEVCPETLESCRSTSVWSCSALCECKLDWGYIIGRVHSTLSSSLKMLLEEANQKREGEERGRLLKLLTFVDAASLVAEIWTVVHFVTLFSAVNAGAVAALELIRTAGQHSCKTEACSCRTINPVVIPPSVSYLLNESTDNQVKRF